MEFPYFDLERNLKTTNISFFYLFVKVSVSLEWSSFLIEMQGNQERDLKKDRNVCASAEEKTRRNLLPNISPVKSLISGLGEWGLEFLIQFSPTLFSLPFSNTVSDLIDTRPLCMKCNASCQIAYTQTLFYFSLRKHRRAKRACENERGARERKIKNYFLLPPPPTPLRWRVAETMMGAKVIFFVFRHVCFVSRIWRQNSSPGSLAFSHLGNRAEISHTKPRRNSSRHITGPSRSSRLIWEALRLLSPSVIKAPAWQLLQNTS